MEAIQVTLSETGGMLLLTEGPRLALVRQMRENTDGLNAERARHGLKPLPVRPIPSQIPVRFTPSGPGKVLLIEVDRERAAELGIDVSGIMINPGSYIAAKYWPKAFAKSDGGDIAETRTKVYL